MLTRQRVTGYIRLHLREGIHLVEMWSDLQVEIPCGNTFSMVDCRGQKKKNGVYSLGCATLFTVWTDILLILKILRVEIN